MKNGAIVRCEAKERKKERNEERKEAGGRIREMRVVYFDSRRTQFDLLIFLSLSLSLFLSLWH